MINGNVATNTWTDCHKRHNAWMSVRVCVCGRKRIPNEENKITGNWHKMKKTGSQGQKDVYSTSFFSFVDVFPISSYPWSISVCVLVLLLSLNCFYFGSVLNYILLRLFFFPVTQSILPCNMYCSMRKLNTYCRIKKKQRKRYMKYFI